MVDTRKNAPWLAQRLRQRIASGEWVRGGAIPARRALAAEYQAALTTVERSVATLIAEGLLRADDRRGTFVTDTAVGAAKDTSPPASRSPVQATVGLVAGLVPYASHTHRREQWPARILEACEHTLAGQSGVSHCFVNMEPELGRHLDAETALERLRAAAVDAVIIIEPDAASQRMLTQLTDAGTPVVCAAFEPFQDRVPEVCADSVAGGSLAIQHLRSRGFGRFIYLRPFTGPWVETRLAGARNAAGPDGLSVFPATTGHELPTDSIAQAQAGAATATALLAAGIGPGTGIIAPNDAVAAGFMRITAAAGLSEGRDFGIIGFDDWERDLGLSSLRPPVEQIGEEAANMLLRLLRGDACPSHVSLPYRLIARTSTRNRTASLQKSPV